MMAVLLGHSLVEKTVEKMVERKAALRAGNLVVYSAGHLVDLKGR